MTRLNQLLARTDEALSEIRGVDFSGDQDVGDDELKAICGIEGITALDLTGTRITDAGLPELTRLPNLCRLEIGQTPITDEELLEVVKLTGLPELAEQSNLSWRAIGQTPITDAGMREVAKLTGLTTLRIRGTNISSIGLHEIAKLTGLTNLCLINTFAITDDDVAAFQQLRPDLHVEFCDERKPARQLAAAEVVNGKLDLSRILFAPGMLQIKLASLADPAGVTELDLAHTLVRDDDLAALAVLSNLTTLKLEGGVVTDTGLGALTVLSNLAVLDLASTDITDVGLRELAKLPNLTRLTLANGITDAWLAELAKLPSLTTLNISNMTEGEFTEVGLKKLAGLANLTRLSITGVTDITNGVMDAALTELVKLPKLTRLGLFFVDVTDAGMKELAKLSTLTVLSLMIVDITDAGLAELVRCEGLTNLNLYCTSITAAGLDEFRLAKPNVEIYQRV